MLHKQIKSITATYLRIVTPRLIGSEVGLRASVFVRPPSNRSTSSLAACSLELPPTADVNVAKIFDRSFELYDKKNEFKIRCTSRDSTNLLCCATSIARAIAIDIRYSKSNLRLRDF